MSNAIVSFEPNVDQLNEIKNWLLIEDQEKRFAGLYCNWNSIEYSLGRKEIAIILLGETPIGFLTWFKNERAATIQITEIKPGLRRMGYGEILLEAVVNQLQNEGIVVLDLHCQPATSKKAWKKLGFKNYPDVEDFSDFNHEDGNWLYKILVPFEKPTKSAANKEAIDSIQRVITLSSEEIETVTSLWNEKTYKKGDFFLEEGRICKYAGFVGSQRK